MTQRVLSATPIIFIIPPPEDFMTDEIKSDLFEETIERFDTGEFDDCLDMEAAYEAAINV